LASCLKSPNTEGARVLFQGQSAGLSAAIPTIRKNNTLLPNGPLGMAIRWCHSDFHYLIKMMSFGGFCVTLIIRRATTPSLRAVKYFRLPFPPEGSLLFV